MTGKSYSNKNMNPFHNFFTPRNALRTKRSIGSTRNSLQVIDTSCISVSTEAFRSRPTTIRKRSSMPNSYTMTITITSNTEQRGNLQGSFNLSPVGFFFKEIESRIKGDAQLRGYKVNKITCSSADKPQLPYEDKN